MEKLINLLNNQTENHIASFLWIHGEDTEIIKNEIRHIYDSGIRALCVEARPHSDFNGPKWFEDIGTILTECKRLGMKMWLLDDSHFPTGYVNGEVQKNYPELCKQFLICKTMDFAGPQASTGAVLKYALRSPEDKILGVSLSRKVGYERIDPTTTMDLLGQISEICDLNTGKPCVDMMGRLLPGTQAPTAVVNFDLPEGGWSLNVLSVSYIGGEKETAGYLNPLRKEATDILLEKVYQPVYDKFGADFGETFQGFFSDEPRFGNIHGAEYASIGRNSAMDLPWSDDLPRLLTEQCNRLGGLLSNMTEQRLMTLLPLLFLDSTEDSAALTHALRYAYMELISRLYSENFDGRLAEWCHAHNCWHIGHTVEDMQAASRLGYGAGHIFRAMAHADMAGVDVVLHQLMPGQDHGFHKGVHTTGWDADFFNFLLGKFGGSLAHLDEKKQGRCMCELFGAYGWAEGNRLGKWMADHMMVRGVNYLVPHAFDCAPFPDIDCPPHFYAEGKNPQYPEFRILMDYCNRLCTLLSGGYNVTPIALYFNAEGEWSGDYMLTQRPAALLAESQIDYDLISDDFLRQAKVSKNLLCVGQEQFRALVLPWSEALPGRLLEQVFLIARQGVRVYFLEGLPVRTSEGVESTVLRDLETEANVTILCLEHLVQTLREDGIHELLASCPVPRLRYYHYRQKDTDLYFFVNEDPHQRAVCEMQGGQHGFTYQYDALTNELRVDSSAFTLDLPPYGSKLVVVTQQPLAEALPQQPKLTCNKTIPLGQCTVELASINSLTNGSATVYSETLSMDQPGYINKLPGKSGFAGRIRYTFHPILAEEDAGKPFVVVLDGVCEAAAVTVNGQYCGTKIVPDYRFAGAGLKNGENLIQVELNTTLARAVNDGLSSYMLLEPTGLQAASIVISE